MKIPRSPVRCTTPGQDRAGPRVEARTARATGQQGGRTFRGVSRGVHYLPRFGRYFGRCRHFPVQTINYTPEE